MTPQHSWTQLFQLWEPPSPQLPGELTQEGQLRSALAAEIQLAR